MSIPVAAAVTTICRTIDKETATLSIQDQIDAALMVAASARDMARRLRKRRDAPYYEAIRKMQSTGTAQ